MGFGDLPLGKRWWVFCVGTVALAGTVYTAAMEHAAPGTSQWFAGVIGTAIGIVLLPLVIGAATRFKSPGACLLVAAGVTGLMAIGANRIEGHQALPAIGSAATPTTPANSATDPATEHWNTTAAAFEAAHPDIKLANNAAVMQEAVNHVFTATMTDADLLSAGYQAARSDARWTFPQPAYRPDPPPGYSYAEVEQQAAVTPAEPDPGVSFYYVVRDTAAACVRAGGAYTECYVKASPARCAGQAASMVADPGQWRRGWYACVRSCGTAGVWSRTVGDCRR